MELFVSGATARCAAELVGVNSKTAAYDFHRLRMIIDQATQDETAFAGEVEVEERYFGGVRKGKRGRGAAGKVPVFGLLKRGGRVYAKVIPDTKSHTLKSFIEQRVVPDSMVDSDHYRSYNVLDVSGFKHFRINHSERFADKQNHMNGIEQFWNQAKRHLRRLSGIPKMHFPLCLKEGEWRFNTPQPKAQLQQLKRWAKRYLV